MSNATKLNDPATPKISVSTLDVSHPDVIGSMSSPRLVSSAGRLPGAAALPPGPPNASGRLADG